MGQKCSSEWFIAGKGPPTVRAAVLALTLTAAWFAAPNAAQALEPPEPFVMAPDGVTELTLEQAGILNPDGRKWAIILGKSLFWDHQAGSDGNACASCHFNAGADTRLRNQLNPGFNDITKGASGDTAFGSERSDTGTVPLGRMPSGAVAHANYFLTKQDMPLHRLENEQNRNSRIVTTTNDRVSSQGAFDTTFGRIKIFGQPDKCDLEGAIFNDAGLAVRQVEPRQTPTTINSAFFYRNFWDGRANNLFNGVGVFGMRDIAGNPNARLIVLKNNAPTLDYLQVENASLASQAVGPPTSDLEMSCGGRSFPVIGRKLLLTIPLLNQKISRTDSVLGPYVSLSGKGLQITNSYAALIMKAFQPKYWSAFGLFKIKNGQLVRDIKGYTQMETNFSMFWGISIMLYERTLVSDQSEFDTLQNSGRLSMRTAFVPAGPAVGGCTGDAATDPLLVRGCTIFSRLNVGLPTPADGIRGGNCFVCHNSQGGGVRFNSSAPGTPSSHPLLSEGSIQLLTNGTTKAVEPFTLFLTVGDVNGTNDLRDQGFAGIGLRPPFTDRVSGNSDPYGNPLSFGRQAWNYLKTGDASKLLDPPLKRAFAGLNSNLVSLVGGTTPLTIVPPPAVGAGNFSKLEVDGSSKAPGLRNVALAPPYFSWGGYPDLRQVLKTYNRGMNRRDIDPTNPTIERPTGTSCSTGDNSGTGPDGNQPHPMPSTVTDCNTNTTGLIIPLGLSDCDNPATCPAGQTTANDDLAALERFLKSLTDRRVQCDAAPFDHPQLTMLDGHKPTDPNKDGKATDITFSFPEVGAAGYDPNSGYCIPNSGDLFAPGMQARTGGPKIPLPVTPTTIAAQ
jgi:cytochrome c peroxidase